MVKKLKLKMTTYSVLVPIAGTLRVAVDAVSDVDAQAIGFELAEAALGDLSMTFKTASIQKWAEIESLEAYEHIVEGNVCNPPNNDIEVAELKDED